MSFTGNMEYTHNLAAYGGGISASYSSTMKFTGNCIFTNNSVIDGGAVYTESSVLSFQGRNTFSGNSAQYSAGGVYSRNSTLTFTGSTNFSSNTGQLLGGGIYGFGTLLYFTGNCSFTANSAARGGGEYLINSFNFVTEGASVTMDGNNATKYGGAVYVEDSHPISYCFPDITNLERCFFQVDGLLQISFEELERLAILDRAANQEFLQLNESTAQAIRTLLIYIFPTIMHRKLAVQCLVVQ